jgi:hypothetical protein
MELTLVDASNPIREWMERARFMVEPKLDEESPETDACGHHLQIWTIDCSDCNDKKQGQYCMAIMSIIATHFQFQHGD